MYDHILVPTDGSPCSDHAVDHALDLAAASDATVTALFVADVERVCGGAPAITVDEGRDALVTRGEEVTEAVETRAVAAGVDVATAVEEGAPTSVITRYAADTDADLVVVGTHGRSGLDRHLVGSVAERTVRHAPTPVLTVRRTTS